jgi:hypothetical protein
MLSFLAAVWAGAVRTVLCPRCRGSQAVVRRPMPFEVTCRDCRRPFHVAERGPWRSESAEAGRPQ